MKNNSKILSLGKLILIIISAMSISALCFAKDDAKATSQSYSFAKQPFDAIQLNGAFETTVQVTHQSNIADVTITASSNLLPYVKVYVKNKTLYVSKRDDWEPHSFEKIKIMVNTGNLESIKTNGSGNSYINNIKVNNFVAEINGAGNIILQGNSKKLAAKINGSGEIDAKNLITEKAAATIYGSGNIIANATQKIDIKIYGSGKIEYYGNPQDIEQSINGSGKIKAM